MSGNALMAFVDIDKLTGRKKELLDHSSFVLGLTAVSSFEQEVVVH